MVDLELCLKLKIRIPDELNEKLERGDPQAFKDLESHLTASLNTSSTFLVNKLFIADAGPYNVGDWEPRS